MEFKRQTNRSTRQDRTTNINLFLNGFEFSVLTSKYWGDFSESNEKNPLIEIDIDGTNYRMSLEDFKLNLKPLLEEGKKGLNWVK